ncbi:hypothetical protein MHYP_G00007100 [Metynnis hypsauchen]
MTITSVSKSHEGLYHCTHPEKGESPKSWISVRISDSESNHGTAGVVVGLSLTFLIIVILSLFWCYKKKKGSLTPPAGNQQNTNQSQTLSGPESSYSASTALQADDSGDQSSDVTYAQVVTTKKNLRGKDNAVRKLSDVTYSQIKVKSLKGNSKDDPVELDVTYAEIELKAKKKGKKKQDKDYLPKGKTTADADIVYSELKHNTDKGQFRKRRVVVLSRFTKNSI